MSAPNPYMRGKTNRRGFLREPPTADQFERVTLGLQSARSGERLVVKVIAALVATNAERLRKRVIDAVVAGVTLIELDLAACPRGDNTGFGELVSIARLCRLRTPAIPLLVTAVHPDLLVQLKHFHLDQLFAIQETSEPPDEFPSTPTSLEAHG